MIISFAKLRNLYSMCCNCHASMMYEQGIKVLHEDGSSTTLILCYDCLEDLSKKAHSAYIERFDKTDALNPYDDDITTMKTSTGMELPISPKE